MPGSLASVLKRTAGSLVTIVLAAVILVQLGYLGRGLAEGWICREAERRLSEATGSTVKVGGLSGNWLDHISIDDVSLSGTEGSLLQEIEGLRLELWYSPLDLLAGDLGGLRSCRITAETLRIRTDGKLPVGGPGQGDTLLLGELSGLFSAGADLEISEFSYGNSRATRAGRLQIILEPGTEQRTVQIAHQGTWARLSTHPDKIETLGFDVMLAADDPGHIGRCLGVESEFQEGELSLSCHVALQPMEVAGTLRLSAFRYGLREIAASRLSWSLDPESLQVHEGNLQLAGVSLHTNGLVAPNPLTSTSMPLEAIRGDLDVDVTDLSPYLDLFPELRDWLPLRGRLSTWVKDGRLRIVEAWIETEDARVELSRGDIGLASLVAGPGAGDAGEVDFELLISAPRAVEIPGVGELRTTGSIRGTLAGSLSRPRLRGQLELGQTSLREFRAERLSATLVYEEDRIRVTNLRAFELGTTKGRVLARLEGQVELALTEGSGPSLQVTLAGQASPDWLELLDISDPTLRSITPPSFTVTGNAELSGAAPTGFAELTLSDLELPPHPPVELSVSLGLTEQGILEVSRGTLRGPLSLDFRGSLPVQGGPVHLTLQAPEQDLAFPTSFLPASFPLGSTLAGTFSLDLQVEGELDALALQVQLQAEIRDAGRLLEPFWPVESLGPLPEGSAHVELTARQAAGRIEIDHLLVETGWATVLGQGPIPLGWQPALGISSVPGERTLDLAVRVHAAGPEGMDLPLALAGLVRIGPAELAVEDLSLKAGLGHLEGQVSVAGGWEHWLSEDPDSPAVRGEVQLAELSLEMLPASALGLRALAGKLSGWARLSGTLDRPEPRLELHLAEATIKVGDLPRLEQLHARLTMTGDRITLADLAGTMGAGLLEAELTVQSRNGNLWESPLDAAIAGKIRGIDVLLADDPNLRLRGHVDLDLHGTLAELRVEGAVRITSGRYARRLTLLPDLRARGGAATAFSAGLHLMPIESAFGQRIHLDVGIETTRDFQVRTHILDADFASDLHLRGQASLAHLEGVISSSSGILRLPGTVLRIDSALATFSADNPLQPRLVAQASGRRHGVRVQLDIHGPLGNPEIQISSIPVYAPQELWTLVTTGSLPAALRESGPQGQAALVGSYLAEELAAWYTGESMEDSASFFDRFTFVSGQDISKNGRPSMVVEFALANNLFLQGELDVWEDYNAGIVLRFRF